MDIEQEQLPTREAPATEGSKSYAAATREWQWDIGTGLVSAGDGAMWWDPEFAPLLRQAGLDSFDAVMQGQTGQCLRRLPDRENWRLEFVHPDGRRVAVYLKKHLAAHPSRWRQLAAFGPSTTPGRWEAENIGRLSSMGLPGMRLVAFGEKRRWDGRQESFLMTEELAGFTPLDRFLYERFPAAGRNVSAQETTRRDVRLERLIYQLAEVVRKFHRAGWNHRDLYACHFFVRESMPGEYEIRLIDLQRVQHRRWFRRRWLVKDLAQLAWSIPAERVGCTLRMRFMKWYLGVEKLRPVDRRLIRRVLAKQQTLLRRLGPPQ